MCLKTVPMPENQPKRFKLDGTENFERYLVIMNRVVELYRLSHLKWFIYGITLLAQVANRPQDILNIFYVLWNKRDIGWNY